MSDSTPGIGNGAPLDYLESMLTGTNGGTNSSTSVDDQPLFMIDVQGDGSLQAQDDNQPRGKSSTDVRNEDTVVAASERDKEVSETLARDHTGEEDAQSGVPTSPDGHYAGTPEEVTNFYPDNEKDNDEMGEDVEDDSIEDGLLEETEELKRDAEWAQKYTLEHRRDASSDVEFTADVRMPSGALFCARFKVIESKWWYLTELKSAILDEMRGLQSNFSRIYIFVGQKGLTGKDLEVWYALNSGYYELFELKCSKCGFIIMCPLPLFEHPELAKFAREKLMKIRDPTAKRHCGLNWCEKHKVVGTARVEGEFEETIQDDSLRPWIKRFYKSVLCSEREQPLINFDWKDVDGFLAVVYQQRSNNIRKLLATTNTGSPSFEDVKEALDTHDDSAYKLAVAALRLKAKLKATHSDLAASKQQLARLEAQRTRKQEGGGDEPARPAKKQRANNGKAVQPVDHQDTATGEATVGTAQASSSSTQHPTRASEQSGSARVEVGPPTVEPSTAANNQFLQETAADRKKRREASKA